MKLNKSCSLAALASLIGLGLMGMLFLVAIFTQYANYHFTHSIVEQTQSNISESLLNSRLNLAIASSDQTDIQSILRSHLVFDGIHAIEVRDSNNKILHREAHTSDETVQITSKRFPLLWSHDTFVLDDFDQIRHDNQQAVGHIVIDFVSPKLNTLIFNLMFLSSLILVSVIAITTYMLFSFHRYISAKLTHLIQMTETIKQGKKIAYLQKPDIIEFKQLENSLSTLSETLYNRNATLQNSLDVTLAAKMAIQESEDMKDRFLKSISREIRAPVNNVVGLLAVLKKECKGLVEHSVTHVNACYASANQLSTTMKKLFEFEKLNTKTLSNERTSTDLCTFFATVGSVYLPRFSKKNVLFEMLQKGPVPPKLILIDKNKLLLILDSLIENALNFTDSGAVTVSWKVVNQRLHIQVKDSGVGIPHDSLNDVFTKYSQFSPTHEKGQGLGLYYVKQLSDVLGAELNMQSSHGLGVIVNLEIPFEESSMPDFDDLLPLQGLIIDDDEKRCDFLKKSLIELNVSSSVPSVPEFALNHKHADLIFIHHALLKQCEPYLNHTKRAAYTVILVDNQDEIPIDVGVGVQSALTIPFDITELASIVHFVGMSKTTTENIIIAAKM